MPWSQQVADQADSNEEGGRPSRDAQSEREDVPSTHGSGARQAHSPVVSLG